MLGGDSVPLPAVLNYSMRKVKLNTGPVLTNDPEAATGRMAGLWLPPSAPQQRDV